MNLNEQISRIRFLMIESEKEYDVLKIGDIKSPNGMQILIKSLGGDDIATTHIIGFEDALELSPSFVEFMEKDNHPFDVNNCIYEYNLEVSENYRGQGWGNKIKNECENICLENGIKYICAIVSCNNIKSQSLFKKFGYKKYDTEGSEDLLVLEMF
jgi:ribosomal protein S18 acetylase RimI-like enzyme